MRNCNFCICLKCLNVGFPHISSYIECKDEAISQYLYRKLIILVFALRWNASLRCFKQRNDFIFHCALNKIKMDFTLDCSVTPIFLFLYWRWKEENKNTFLCLNFGICISLYEMLTHVDCWSILNCLQLFFFLCFTSEIPKAV